MRTTVELSDMTRARLLELAARRGQKGFSALVEEAVVRYLEEEEDRKRALQQAVDVLGTLDEEEAAGLEAMVTELRRAWR